MSEKTLERLTLRLTSHEPGEYKLTSRDDPRFDSRADRNAP
jgi:hypothetical protein